jgi:hypothetical protein
MAKVLAVLSITLSLASFGLILWFVIVIGLPRRDLLDAAENRLRNAELRLDQLEVIQFGRPQVPPFGLPDDTEKIRP